MKNFTCIMVFMLPLMMVFGQNPNLNKKKHPITPEPTFKHGEELAYSLKYGFIKGGSAVIRVVNDTCQGNKVLKASATARTTGLVDKLFKVLDVYESYFTPDSNLPLKAVRNIREGSYKYYGEDYFNHKNNTVVNKKKGIVKVPDNILDMISAFFYLRRINFSNFKVGDIVYFDTFFGDDLFPFYVIYKGREEIETDAGTFKCLKFLPIVEPGRIFKENDDMLFWLSDDNNKIPIMVKFDMIVGSFKCELVSYKNLKYSATSLVKED